MTIGGGGNILKEQLMLIQLQRKCPNSMLRLLFATSINKHSKYKVSIKNPDVLVNLWAIQVGTKFYLYIRYRNIAILLGNILGWTIRILPRTINKEFAVNMQIDIYSSVSDSNVLLLTNSRHGSALIWKRNGLKENIWYTDEDLELLCNQHSKGLYRKNVKFRKITSKLLPVLIIWPLLTVTLNSDRSCL